MQIAPTAAAAVAPPAPGEWPCYGRDPGGMRYSPLTQVNRRNVSQLRVAWTYRTGELATYEGTEAARKAAFEATPIMAGGVLYFSTPSNRVIALDAGTGRERWVYDPKVDLRREYSELTSRGVSTWVDGRTGRRRIYEGTIDGRLICLDAADGKPCEDFGGNGQVDLKQGVGPVAPGMYQVTSPPAVIGDLVVVGSSIADNRTVEDARGVVRAFDARTGEQRWSWDPIPRRPGEKGYDTWRGPLAHGTGAANAWAPISVDAARDLVFVPTSSPSPDYYGGERLGDNLYANSVVALRGLSGKVVWGFQAVHHDLWDFDIPMQPVLFELRRGGDGSRPVPAVAFGTKMGHVFVLHRETGEPLFPVEERPVPASDVPGEAASPTQPFPAKLPLLGLRKVTPEDAWGLSDEDRDVSREWIARLRNEGPFTPPSWKGTLMAPGNVGGFNWGGMCYDPNRGTLIGADNRIAAVVTLVERNQDGAGAVVTAERVGPGVERAPMRQTPYELRREYLLDPKTRLPRQKPPWGMLVAIDLKAGGLKWEVPLGSVSQEEVHPDQEKWGSVSLGGPVSRRGVSRSSRRRWTGTCARSIRRRVKCFGSIRCRGEGRRRR
ncbi:MAG TPA: pyrroloquinoline quinone-dependent dehydrogenase [Tepidisphaeraceae bacterium]|nr:pyrroloquinoline quinone-dependent dehydrogenase [Tepidisphaeraceae bacterium]